MISSSVFRRMLALAVWSAFGVLMIASGPGASANGQGGANLAGFPLWKGVPTERFATLKEGKTPHGSRWGVYAYRGDVRSRPCLLVSRITAVGLYGISTGCGALAPSQEPRSSPVVVSVEEWQRNGGPEPTVFYGLSFAPGVERVELVLGSGATIVRQTRLSLAQSRKAQVPRFRFLALSLERDSCIERMTAFDRDGNVVLSSPQIDECARS